MIDPLSIAGIGARQMEIEKTLQGMPEIQRRADQDVVDAEVAYRRAEAHAIREVLSLAPKMTVGERDARVFELVSAQFEAYQVAKVAAEYAKNSSRALFAELTSLASRMKAANEANFAHGRFGQG